MEEFRNKKWRDRERKALNWKSFNTKSVNQGCLDPSKNDLSAAKSTKLLTLSVWNQVTNLIPTIDLPRRYKTSKRWIVNFTKENLKVVADLKLGQYRWEAIRIPRGSQWFFKDCDFFARKLLLDDKLTKRNAMNYPRNLIIVTRFLLAYRFQ